MRKNKISKINIIRAILIILLLATFIRIFCFSNQNGTQSSGVSRKVTEIVTSTLFRTYRKNNKKISTFFNIYSSRITNDVTYEYI